METATDRTAAHAGRPRDDQREQAMLDAALELLVEVGYDRLSIDAITARARASKATFYRRWNNKAEVVSEAVRRFKGRCDDVPLRDTGSLRGDLLAKVGWLCSEVTLDGALVAGVMRAMRSDPELAALVQQHFLDNKIPAAEGMADRAIARGEIAPDAPFPLAFEVASSMIFTRTLLMGEPLDTAFTAQLVDDVLLPLLGARTVTSPRPRHAPARGLEPEGAA